MKLWKTKRSVWFQHNDDSKLGKEAFREKEYQADMNTTKCLGGARRHKQIEKEVSEMLDY